jgi:hypothetical protein
MPLRNLAGLGTCWLAVLLISGCASAPYEPAGMASVPFTDRAQTQSSGGITVTAAVPSPEETQILFGLPLYEGGIQPVWLKIHNGSDARTRYAPVGTDPEYFSSQEVSYVHRSGYSKDAHRKMNFYFHEMSMSRRIPAGETREGFVFTHARPGTKGFNVDLFGATRDNDASFTFFIDVPGFESDHSETYLTELYPPEQIKHLTSNQIREALADVERNTTDKSTQLPGVPINVAIVGEPEDVLQALIRAGWYESPRSGEELSLEAEYFLGRIADIMFTKHERKSGERMELRIWLSPAREGDTPIWVVQVLHFIGLGADRRQLDADLDDATAFFLQDLWYGQGLDRYGWIRGPAAGSFDDPQKTFSGAEYFSSGAMIVMWLSGAPVSMLEVQALEWDASPGGARR